jgi:hypothetical protein
VWLYCFHLCKQAIKQAIDALPQTTKSAPQRLTTMAQRKTVDTNVDNIAGSVDLERGSVAGLLHLQPDELAILLADIANKANIATADFKNSRAQLKSFSKAKWSNLSPNFGLPLNPENLQLERFETARYRLPLSFHKTSFVNAWRWQDVYREKVVQSKEEARVRILDPVC